MMAEATNFEDEVEAHRARNRKLLECLKDDVGRVMDKINKKRKEERAERRAKRAAAAAAKRALEPRRISARLSEKQTINYSDTAMNHPISKALKRRKLHTRYNKFQVRDAVAIAQEATQEAAKILAGKLKNADWMRFSRSIIKKDFWCQAPPPLQAVLKEKVFSGNRAREFKFWVQDRSYDVIVLSKGGFSGGWKELCIKEDFDLGDCAVLQFVNKKKIRMHVLRVSDYKKAG